MKNETKLMIFLGVLLVYFIIVGIYGYQEDASYQQDGYNEWITEISMAKHYASDASTSADAKTLYFGFLMGSRSLAWSLLTKPNSQTLNYNLGYVSQDLITMFNHDSSTDGNTTLKDGLDYVANTLPPKVNNISELHSALTKVEVVKETLDHKINN